MVQNSMYQDLKNFASIFLVIDCFQSSSNLFLSPTYIEKGSKKVNIFRALSAATLVVCLMPAFAKAVELNIDSAHSNVAFEVKHLMVSTVRGNFAQFSGTIDLNEKEMSRSKVNFIVKTDSINTGNEKRDQHLKGADFFDIQKYPEAKFVSTSVKTLGDGKYELVGDLSIHGITKKATFVMGSLGAVKDPFGKTKYMFQASTDLVRKDYGLVWNKVLENGGVLVGDKVKLSVDLELGEAPKVKL